MTIPGKIWNFFKSVPGKLSSVLAKVHSIAGKISQVPIIGDFAKGLYESIPGHQIISKISEINSAIHELGDDVGIGNILDNIKIPSHDSVREREKEEKKEVSRSAYIDKDGHFVSPGLLNYAS